MAFSCYGGQTASLRQRHDYSAESGTMHHRTRLSCTVDDLTWAHFCAVAATPFTAFGWTCLIECHRVWWQHYSRLTDFESGERGEGKTLTLWSGGKATQLVSKRQCRDAKPAPPMPTPLPAAFPCPVDYGVAYSRHSSNNDGSMPSWSGTSKTTASPESQRQKVRSK